MTDTSLKIYIVEPDPIFSLVLYRVLYEIKGVSPTDISIFEDGDAFLKHYQFQNEYSIYIINDILPKQSGTKLIQEIRKQDEEGIIYIMTKSNTNQELIFAIGLGADNYFIKSFDLDVFKAIIERKVQRRHTKWN